jgi:hypothetical protein
MATAWRVQVRVKAGVGASRLAQEPVQPLIQIVLEALPLGGKVAAA